VEEVYQMYLEEAPHLSLEVEEKEIKRLQNMKMLSGHHELKIFTRGNV